MRPFVLALLAAALAGCLDDDGAPSAGAWSFSGTFTEAATQAEMQALGDEMRSRFGADVLLLESFPVQLRVRGLASEAACVEARDLAASKPYVARVGECAEDAA